MNDCISRKAAINAICRDWCNRDYCGDCFFHGARQAIDVLKALPSADAVEVVRCKDCDSAECSGVMIYCLTHGCYMRDNDFCNYGHKDGEQDG